MENVRVFETKLELRNSYWNYYVDQEFSYSDDTEFYSAVYHLFEEQGIIIKSIKAMHSPCECGNCKFEKNVIVAWVKGFDPYGRES